MDSEFRIPNSGFRFPVPIPDSGFRFPVSGFLVLGLPIKLTVDVGGKYVTFPELNVHMNIIIIIKIKNNNNSWHRELGPPLRYVVICIQLVYTGSKPDQT